MTVALAETSRRIRFADFAEPWFLQRESELKLDHKCHRKHWEHAIIAETFRQHIEAEHSMVLGFGVGTERLPAWFAAQGAYVLATDLPEELLTEAWRNDKHVQHAASHADLANKGICSDITFGAFVDFRPVDMRDIPGDLEQGQFDMTWSAGAFEHIGGIAAGLEFFAKQMRCLKPGGLAVHTTEFNYGSDDETINEHDLCFFTRGDLEQLEMELETQGDQLWPLDLAPGEATADGVVSIEPHDQLPHINVMVGGHTTTSVLLVAERGGAQ